MMVAAAIVHAAYKLAWAFYALGPQMVICLALGFFTARRNAGSLLNWLAVAFFVSLLPLAGVIVMLVLWRGARRSPSAERPA